MPTYPINHLRRAILFGVIGATVTAFGGRPAWADDDDGDDDDEDNGGHGSHDDDEEESDPSDDDNDDDNSGHGNDGDDDSGPDNGGDDSNPGENRRESDDNNDNSPDRSIRDISVAYPDGWVERIVNGRYELFDDLNRRVIRRNATSEDFDRMLALR